MALDPIIRGDESADGRRTEEEKGVDRSGKTQAVARGPNRVRWPNDGLFESPSSKLLKKMYFCNNHATHNLAFTAWDLARDYLSPLFSFSSQCLCINVL